MDDWKIIQYNITDISELNRVIYVYGKDSKTQARFRMLDKQYGVLELLEPINNKGDL